MTNKTKDRCKETLVVRPGPRDRSVCLEDGTVLDVPQSWTLLPPGDAGVTRRVKAAGPTWTVKQKRGRRVVSLGVWADGKQIAEAKRGMEATRSTPQYAKQRVAAKQRRDKVQSEYVDEFHAAVVVFLAFAPEYAAIAERFATAVAAHATPVGSGTVARTKRIPVGQRAESAVIAWMRHQTTAYDDMKIARIRGKRREVRRELAAQSRRLLQKYRDGESDAMVGCPLAAALRNV
ncbi:MAG: DUF2293 domain-containing protein [Planctomycetota bacterium]